MSNEIGKRFAEAIAAKDSGALLEVLDPDVDFRGLTPGKFWEATSATTLVDIFVLGQWFEPSDHIDVLEDVQSGSVAGRDRVSYRLRITNADGTFLVEQQAYYDVESDRITWLRILCSGFQAIDENLPTH